MGHPRTQHTLTHIHTFTHARSTHSHIQTLTHTHAAHTYTHTHYARTHTHALTHARCTHPFLLHCTYIYTEKCKLKLLFYIKSEIFPCSPAVWRQDNTQLCSLDE